MIHRPSRENLANADPQELAALAADCLSLFEPGVLPLPVFAQVARLAVLGSMELVPFRAGATEPEILLAQRSPDDLWWPGQWHAPGTIIRATDEEENAHDFASPGDRALKAEFAGTIVRTAAVRPFDVQRRTGIRGSEISAFCWTEVCLADGAERPYSGEFFNAHDVLAHPPKEGLIKLHPELIEQAIPVWYAAHPTA